MIIVVLNPLNYFDIILHLYRKIEKIQYYFVCYFEIFHGVNFIFID